MNKVIILSIQPQWLEKISENEIKQYAIEYMKLRLINIWENMRQRCYNPKSARYLRYGGRGIKICDEWINKNGKNNFILWGLNNGYKPDLSIERIDINKNYCPENCRWIKLSEQNKNTKRTIFVTHNGITMCVSDWCKKLNLKSNTIYCRAKKNGGDYYKAIFEFKKYKKGEKTHCKNGHEYTFENTLYDKNGYRICKICNKINHKRFKEKIKNAKNNNKIH